MARDNKRDKHQAQQRMVKAKACPFCKEGVKGVDYKDVALLRKFISDRGK
jgi:small subunit ribosomal protein S18